MMSFFRKHLFYKAASLVLAIVLWLYVGNAFTGAQQLTLPLEVVGLEPNMVVEDIPKTITIRIQGNKDMVSGLTSKDFRATVNLKGAPVGLGTYPIDVQAPAKVQVLVKTPAELTLNVDILQDKEIPVVVRPKNAPEGYVAVESSAKPAVVVITGPSQKLKSVDQALAELAVDGRTVPQTGTAAVRLTDKKGKGVEDPDIKVSPKVVDVSIRLDIDKTLAQKRVDNLAVAVQGGVGGKEYKVTPVQVSVTVEGIQRDMARLKTENVKPSVDVSALGVGVHEVPLQLTLPAGVKALRMEPDRVTVTVEEKTGKEGEKPVETPNGQPQTGPR